MMILNRREFFKLWGAVFLPPLVESRRALLQSDWDHETPLVISIREYLESVIGGMDMALDFRCINAQYDEEFRIQINAFNLYPVASCFKAFLALYYFLYTPQSEWQYDQTSRVYRSIVFSDNTATGIVLHEVAQRVTGRQNAIEKFNDFLRITIGLANGLHTWNWPDTPVAGLSDPRFAPSESRVVYADGQPYPVDNAFTAADLGRGYDFLWRGAYFTRSPALHDAIGATRDLLPIPASGYQSPIERVYPEGYLGKDGILPASDVATGRVVDDAGVLRSGDNAYIIAFMSAGESESTAISVLREVVGQIAVYEG